MNLSDKQRRNLAQAPTHRAPVKTHVCIGFAITVGMFTVGVACGGRAADSAGNSGGSSGGGRIEDSGIGGQSKIDGSNGGGSGGTYSSGGVGAGAMSGTGAVGAGGSDGTGGSGTGGMGGATGGTAAGGDGGIGAGPTGVVAEPESECSAPGALACAGNHQRLTLVCVGGKWQVNETCPENYACDSTPGFDQGTCKERLPECAEHEPGYEFCSGPTTVTVCGPDNVTLLEEQCPWSCVDGECNDCPAGDYINCGTQCRERDCLETSCVLSTGTYLVAPATRIIRTSSFNDACPAECNAQVHGIHINLKSDPTTKVKVTVPSPWRISNEGFCAETSAQECLIATSDEYLYLFTDDPTAPERNLTFEAVSLDASLECP